MQGRICIKPRSLSSLIVICSVFFIIVFGLIWMGNTSVDVDELQDLDYAVVVDAGSSGSRLFVYIWPPHVGNPQQLLKIRPLLDEHGDPVVMKKSPGLSSVAGNPQMASDYMFPLLNFATAYIPSAKHKETPLFILATAGLRLLDKEVQEAILDDLRQDVPQNFSFLVSEKSVDVISGELEGVYQWIATNYVLTRFDHDDDIGDAVVAVDLPDGQSEQSIIVRKQTAGILDMGGASLQLAVEVTNKFDLDDVKSSVVDINLGCLAHDVDHLYKIFVTTFLGMGANEARLMYEKLLVTDAIAANSSVNKSSLLAETIPDPCLAKGFVTQINVTLESLGPSPSTVNLKGSGNFDVCRTRLVQQVKNLTNCPGKACISNRLPFNIGNTLFYGFSEFWYSMEDVFREGGKYVFKNFRTTVLEFCKTPWESTYRRYNEKLYPLADWQRLTLECFKAAWMTAVLHDGLGFATNYDGLRSTPNSVHEKVFHWTLGALVYRTRFFPLKELQKSVKQSNIRRWNQWPNSLGMHMLLVCMGLVLVAIFMYLQRLRCLTRCFSPKTNHAYYSPLALQQDHLERGFVNQITYFK